MFDVEIREMPDHTFAGMYHKGAYHEIAQTFEKLGEKLGKAKAWPSVKGMAGIYYDDPDNVAEADLRSMAAAVVGSDFAPPDDVDVLNVPGGKTAVLRFKGPYTGFQAAYHYLFGEWVPASGLEVRNEPCYELYLNSPMDTAPEELLTDICLPLA